MTKPRTSVILNHESLLKITGVGAMTEIILVTELVGITVLKDMMKIDNVMIVMVLLIQTRLFSRPLQIN